MREMRENLETCAVHKFKSELQSESVKAKFESITENTSESSAEIVNKLTEILLSCAETSGLKQMHKRKGGLPDNPPWFDKDCKKLKSEIRALAKRLKALPCNNVIGETIFLTKRKLHNRVRKGKTAYKNDILEKMHLSNKKEPKKFWRLLDKMNGRANRTRQSHINAENWISYFKSIFNSDNGVSLPQAPGLDNITNEMLICSVKFYPRIFLYVFNHILKHGGQIPTWAVSLLVPIYKKGNSDDPENYRGISLLSCIAKFFLIILNNRLLSYCMNNNVLSDSQLGFLPGNRTSDAHIMLYNLMRTYMGVLLILVKLSTVYHAMSYSRS